jgi:hypothetical protein
VPLFILDLFYHETETRLSLFLAQKRGQSRTLDSAERRSRENLTPGPVWVLMLNECRARLVLPFGCLSGVRLVSSPVTKDGRTLERFGSSQPLASPINTRVALQYLTYTVPYRTAIQTLPCMYPQEMNS